jgi:hypothetical protein
MYQSPLTPSFDGIKHPSYQVRVRGTMYLWGSAGINAATIFTFDKPLLLHIRNNVFGQQITLATVSPGGPPTALGTLDPGECYTIRIQTMSGVTATCSTESAVDCLIETHS